MFFIVLLTIWGSVLTHIFLRTISLLRFGRWFNISLAVVLYTGGFGYIPARIMIRFGDGDTAAAAFLFLSSCVIGVVAICWTLLVVFECGALLYRLIGRKRIRQLSKTRRRSIGGTLWAATLVLAAAGFCIAHSTPGVTTLKLTVPNGGAARVAFIADQHLGAISSESQWRKVLRKVADLDPDALLIPGDLIDDHSRHTGPQVGIIRKYLPDTDIFVTTGNHEFYAGTAEFEEICGRFGLRLLRQETAELSPGLTVTGIDDQHLVEAGEAGRKTLDNVEGPVIFLSHRPSVARLLEKRPMTLVLSGHTHGGQMPPMTFFVAMANGGFRSGHYRVGSANLYVTNGSGTWGPPMRLFAPPEIVLIETVPGERFKVERR